MPCFAGLDSSAAPKAYETSLWATKLIIFVRRSYYLVLQMHALIKREQIHEDNKNMEILQMSPRFYFTCTFICVKFYLEKTFNLVSNF
jgi:hypothetical protein